MTRFPKMQHQKSRNLAKVRLKQADGKIKDIYLGPWDSDKAQQRYDGIIACLLTSSRNADSVNVTLNRLCILFLQHAERYYVKNGEPTSEVSVIRIALREVVAECGKLPVAQFSPLRFKGVRERMISHGWKRKSINQQIRRIVRMLKRGVENELVPTIAADGCGHVRGLAKGRSEAAESEPVSGDLDDFPWVDFVHRGSTEYSYKLRQIAMTEVAR